MDETCAQLPTHPLSTYNNDTLAKSEGIIIMGRDSGLAKRLFALRSSLLRNHLIRLLEVCTRRCGAAVDNIHGSRTSSSHLTIKCLCQDPCSNFMVLEQHMLYFVEQSTVFVPLMWDDNYWYAHRRS